MFAQMRHMAIVTSNANTEGDFYQDVFRHAQFESATRRGSGGRRRRLHRD